MIVNLKLSIDDRALEEAFYHCQRLKELADSSTSTTAGYIYFDFNGYKGKAQRTGHSKYKHRSRSSVEGSRANIPPTAACNLFEQ